jgi:hypothetical protein
MQVDSPANAMELLRIVREQLLAQQQLIAQRQQQQQEEVQNQQEELQHFRGGWSNTVHQLTRGYTMAPALRAAPLQFGSAYIKPVVTVGSQAGQEQLQRPLDAETASTGPIPTGVKL